MQSTKNALAAIFILATTGCATDISMESQAKVSQCEASGGVAKVHVGINPRFKECLSASRVERLAEMEMACLKSGGNPAYEGFKVLSTGGEIYRSCERPSARADTDWAKVYDVDWDTDLGTIEVPENNSRNETISCRSTTTNGVTNTYCN